jgi:hypothetical protein
LKNALMTPELERLVGRAVLDTEFRDTLLANPAATATKAGFTLSPEELANVQKFIMPSKHQFASEDVYQAFWG